MNRNSNTLFLESPNAITPVPWVNNAPDFTGFTEPTLSVLQDAYQANINNIVIIPDPITEPPSPPQPDWDGFMADCDDVFAAGLNANYLVFTQIFNMLLALKAKGSDFEKSPEWRNFAFKYQIGKASLTPEQIAQVESAMANNNIPVLS